MNHKLSARPTDEQVGNLRIPEGQLSLCETTAARRHSDASQMLNGGMRL